LPLFGNIFKVKEGTLRKNEWAAVAQRRLSEIKSGSVKPVPGKEVFEKIWRKFEQ
jgi:hypothetical protein